MFISICIILVGFDLRAVARAEGKATEAKEASADLANVVENHLATDSLQTQHLVEAINDLKLAVKEIHQDIRKYRLPLPGGE
jgi:hypothetical protein